VAKEKKVKWALGGSEPDDLAEFKDNDQIVKEHTKGKGKDAEVSWPPRGSHVRCLIRQMKVKPNKNGDDRISVMLVVDEPKKSDLASWNNYAMFDGFNVTDQGAPYIKRFLKAVGLSWSDFMDKTKQDDQDPPHITQIAGVKFEGGTKPVHVMCAVKVKPADDYNDTEYLDAIRYVPKDDDAGDDSGSEDEPAAEVMGGGDAKKGKKKKDKAEEPAKGKKKGKGKKGKDEPPF
jgi:hypothetical protein